MAFLTYSSAFVCFPLFFLLRFLLLKLQMDRSMKVKRKTTAKFIRKIVHVNSNRSIDDSPRKSSSEVDLIFCQKTPYLEQNFLREKIVK